MVGLIVGITLGALLAGVVLVLLYDGLNVGEW